MAYGNYNIPANREQNLNAFYQGRNQKLNEQVAKQKLSMNELEMAQNQADRVAQEQTAQQQNAMMQDVMGTYEAGDKPGAIKKSVFLDDKNMKKFLDVVDRMDEQQKRDLLVDSEAAARIAYAAKNHTDPEAYWKQEYELATPTVQAMMRDEKFNPDWANRILMQNMNVAEIINQQAQTNVKTQGEMDVENLKQSNRMAKVDADLKADIRRILLESKNKSASRGLTPQDRFYQAWTAFYKPREKYDRFGNKAGSSLPDQDMIKEFMEQSRRVFGNDIEAPVAGEAPKAGGNEEVIDYTEYFQE